MKSNGVVYDLRVPCKLQKVAVPGATQRKKPAPSEPSLQLVVSISCKTTRYVFM